ncbi:NAD(P)H:quinone oxidoreductase [Anaerococcus sp. AGMB00486]|uniref:NAD(P)H:quinone oxidoreductase n=1 Tax=Anaerococcus faecalis TaxID=2742993 RepID=A0ABX2NBC6_9FIRM|nr:NAD(P)H:quinone oxidoreductase [Anaerococcus faecalis]NVF12001.1 NAD(P)H:quinone oxidoreductase [Anaerococcus faecalis]
MKLAIIYYSQTGHNFQMAKWAKEEAEKNGAEVRLLKVKETLDESLTENNPAWKKYLDESKYIEEATSDDLIWADAILFSTPTRFGNVASQLKAFIDAQGGIWAQGKLINKVVSAMSSAQNNNGGQEGTIKAIYTTAAHWGAIILPIGYTADEVYTQGGNPYGASGTATNDGFANDLEGAVRVQAKRVVDVTSKLVD